MKKILLYIFFFILLCFVIPIIFTKTNIQEEVVKIMDNNDTAYLDENINESVYDYKEYKIVKVLHVKTNEIEEIPLDEYIYGVVASEMPADFEIEALKAQAVVARTYTIYKIQNNNRKA